MKDENVCDNDPSASIINTKCPLKEKETTILIHKLWIL